MAKKKTRLILLGVILAVLVLVFLWWRAGTWAEKKQNTQLLLLVNAATPLEKEPNPDFALLDDGHMLDVRCVEPFEQMLADARTAGYEFVVIEAYISRYEQQAIYDEKVTELIASGMGEELASSTAAETVPPPGCSEHELGLAVDLADAEHPALDGEQAALPGQLWLQENSWRYGFILRYPEDKSAVTGVSGVPWHYRYVGQEAAGQMHELGITLEEYINMFYS